MSQAPAFDAHDPESQGAWRQWVTDAIRSLQKDVEHLHNCIETRTAETKAMVAEKASSAEELAESRHQQNLEAMKRIGDSVDLLKTFRENATQKEIEAQAVAAERRRLADEKARRREQLKSTAWKLIEYGAGAGIATLALAGLVSIARMFGL